MVATIKGADIISAMRASAIAKGYADHAERPAGRIASFCKQVRLDTKNPNQIDIVTVATTDDIDLEGEVVLPEGADWTYLQKNKAIFLDHCYGSRNAVATLRSLTRQGNGWVFRATLLNDPLDENVRAVKRLAEAGILGASIGFEVEDAGQPTAQELKKYPGANYIIRKWHGIEISYTAMPCNVACRTQSVTFGGDEKVAAVRELLTKGRTPPALMEAMGLKPRAKRVIVWTGE